jgi:hypothetical protein
MLDLTVNDLEALEAPEFIDFAEGAVAGICFGGALVLIGIGIN